MTAEELFIYSYVSEVAQHTFTINVLSSSWRGNSTVGSVSVCHAVRPGSRPVRSVSERWNSITELLTRSHQCRRLVQKKAVHVSLCLCNDACKRSLAICCKSRASCPISRLLSVPIWPACAKQGREYDSINQ